MCFRITVCATVLLFGAAQIFGGCARPDRNASTTRPVVRISASKMLNNASFQKNHKSLLGTGVIYSPKKLINQVLRRINAERVLVGE